MRNKESKNNTMQKKEIQSGRPKGSLNKKTEWLFEKCEELGADPVLFMVQVMQNDWKALGYESEYLEKQGFQGIVTEEPVISMDHRVDAAKYLIKFMYPARKAIEIKNEGDNDKGFKFQLVPPSDAKN